MYLTEPINVLIALFGASLPITYVYIVSRCMKGDLVHTDEIAEEPGQTHNTAIIDEKATDGHSEYACGHPVVHHDLAPAH